MQTEQEKAEATKKEIIFSLVALLNKNSLTFENFLIRVAIQNSGNLLGINNNLHISGDFRGPEFETFPGGACPGPPQYFYN